MRQIILMLFLLFNLLSCKKVENKLNKISFINEPKNFSLKGLVKDFQGDENIKEIKGIQVEDIFYREYFLYTGNKSRVIDGINKINTKGYFSEDCRLITKEDLYKSITKSERNEYTNFFWKFEKLKNIEIYSSIKGLNKHVVIFDLKSDTVYHRVEEFRD